VLTLAVLLPFWKPLQGLPLKVALAALAIGTFSFYFLYAAIETTESLTTVAIATQLMPALSAILAMVFYREAILARKWLGIAVATVGALFLAGATQSTLSVAGLGLTVLSVLFYAGGSIVIGKSTTMEIWRVLAWTAALSVPPLAVFAASTGPMLPDLELLELRHWAALVFVALLSALLGQAVLFRLYRLYPVSDVAPWVLLVPLFAGISSIWLYNEQITLTLVVGGGIVLAGVWIQQQGPKQAAREPGAE
jgi:O-acetylserine/cysteine efflux transporter